jgi:hypothetical protein
VIYVGIDDTDMPDAPGTNKLARALIADLGQQYRCRVIVRHQLLDDPRVPCTSKNSAASLLFESDGPGALRPLVDRLRAMVRDRSAPGSDPGLCVAAAVPEEITAFGKRCQRELVSKDKALRLAARCGVYLEGLGGTEDGVIGALAAVGLAAAGDDGRVVQIGSWPDELDGPQQIATLRTRGVEVRCLDSGTPVSCGTVDVGKHLRPSYRNHRIVLFARRAAKAPGRTDRWQAVRLL